MALQSYVLTRKDPNEDILNAISSLEQRAEKMLTLSIAIISINFFFPSETMFIVSFPFFIISFIFYLLTFLKKPTLLNIDMPREKLYALFEIKAIKAEEIIKINDAENKYRKKFFEVYYTKLGFIKLAHTSLIGLVTIITTTFGINIIFPLFLSDPIYLLFYFIILVLILIIFYLNFFKSEKYQIELQKQ